MVLSLHYTNWKIRNSLNETFNLIGFGQKNTPQPQYAILRSLVVYNGADGSRIIGVKTEHFSPAVIGEIKRKKSTIIYYKICIYHIWLGNKYFIIVISC